MCYLSIKKSGIMYYNPILGDEKCISLVYKILNKNDTARVPDTEHIRNMVKRQATLLPESSKFDYRTLFEEEKECTLDKYFDRELMSVVDSITTSDWSKHTKTTSPTHTHERKLKCMIIMCYNGQQYGSKKVLLANIDWTCMLCSKA